MSLTSRESHLVLLGRHPHPLGMHPQTPGGPQNGLSPSAQLLPTPGTANCHATRREFPSPLPQTLIPIWRRAGIPRMSPEPPASSPSGCSSKGQSSPDPCCGCASSVRSSVHHFQISVVGAQTVKPPKGDQGRCSPLSSRTPLPWQGFISASPAGVRCGRDPSS